jgi:hypothetical protein
MALKQAQRSVASLHDATRHRLHIERILEISTKSDKEVGVKLSAFNLLIKTVKYEQEFSVESAYQSSKVFQEGGPFSDLLHAKSIDAKRDPRLHQHGRLVMYRFFGSEWDLQPRTAFYDWLYMNALHKNEHLATSLLEYEAFSDIAFNPERSINCQAYSAALYVSLSKRGLLSTSVLRDKDEYLDIINRATTSNAHENTVVQSQIF